jgi:hypothetical protein
LPWNKLARKGRLGGKSGKEEQIVGVPECERKRVDKIGENKDWFRNDR